MADAEIDVLPLLRQLLVFARKWSHGIPLDFDAVAQVRRRVLTSNHRHHVREIPIYAQLAREGDITDRDPCELARNRLVLSDDWFKSYDPEWLDGDFASLSAWLEPCLLYGCRKSPIARPTCRRGGQNLRSTECSSPCPVVRPPGSRLWSRAMNPRWPRYAAVQGFGSRGRYARVNTIACC